MVRERSPSDPRGGHIRIYWELHDSNAWKALSMAERGLYTALRRKLKGSNNGNIEATLGEMKHDGVSSSATLAKGLRALMTVGVIAKTRQGGIAWGKKVCCLYRFTDEAVFEHPKQGIKAMKATNDWRTLDTKAKAVAAIKKAHADAKRAPKERESGVQFLNRIGSETESKAELVDSTFEQGRSSPVQKVNKYADHSTALEPA